MGTGVCTERMAGWMDGWMDAIVDRSERRRFAKKKKRSEAKQRRCRACYPFHTSSRPGSLIALRHDDESLRYF